MRVDVRANNEGYNIEERNPSLLREELLGKGKSQRGRDPADFHDGHETSPDCCPDLVEGACACNEGHRNQIHRVLDWSNLCHCNWSESRSKRVLVCDTYDEVANKDLEDLGLQAGAVGKHLLQYLDQQVAHWGTDESSVDGHLRHPGREVMAILVPVLSNP